MSKPSVNYAKNPFLHATANLTRQVFNSAARLTGNHRFDPASFDITRLPLTLPLLDPVFNGYKIVHISDLHMGTWLNLERLQGVVNLVNAQNPDTLVITGDFITHRLPGLIDSMIPALSRLEARDAILAVMGNHDHWSDIMGVRAMLQVCKIHELANQVFTIERKTHNQTAQLHFAGLDDAYNHMDDLDHVLDCLPASEPAILLVHIPDFADQSAKTNKFNLQLSGHSHGGQIVLPWLGAPVLPPHGRKYQRGLYQIGGMYLYTNRGIGTATLPIRINCRPEIAVITLYSHTE